MDNVTQALRDHYRKTFRQYGAGSMGVDWGADEKKQLLRYEKMLAVITQRPGETPGVLDVGCGYGGLLDYANRKSIPIDYTGIDVVEDMISWAQNAFPEVRFIAGDIFTTHLDGSFDYVICNGILTQKLDTPGLMMDEFAGKLIRRMFDLCRIGIAFNLMTTKVNFFSNNLYYRNPSELLSWCMSEITGKVRLDHSYELFEYTVYLYR